MVMIGFLIWQNHNSEDNSSEEGETSKVEEGDAQEGTGSNLVVNVKAEDEQMEEKKVPQYDGENPNENNDLSGVVTYAGVNGSTLMIRVNIDQYLNSGVCELALKRGGATIYNSTANIVSSASTATCEGFDVPVNGLGGGNVEINIKLKAGDKGGVINGEVNI